MPRKPKPPTPPKPPASRKPKPSRPVQGPKGVTTAQARANRVDDARLDTLRSAVRDNVRRNALNAAERFTPRRSSGAGRPSQTSGRVTVPSTRDLASVARADAGRRRTMLSLNSQSREAQRAFDFWTGQTLSQRDEGMRAQSKPRKPKLPPAR